MRLKIMIFPFLFTLFSISSFCQQNDLIDHIGTKLQKNETTISKVLSDTAYMPLHSLTSFREMIKQNAKPERIKLNSNAEPGTKIIIKGSVVNRSGKPMAGKLVYVYQTSSEGWNSDTAPHISKNEGDRKHARLFGYFKTDFSGAFEFETVKPKGYPNSSLPAHIHIEISLDDGNFISELLFDDDPRLVGDIRTRSIEEQFYIAKNSGSVTEPVYRYKIQLNH